MNISKDVKERYIKKHLAELEALTETLCRIPAPLGREKARAEFCKAWLEAHGARNVRLDGADNAVLELNASHPMFAKLQIAVAQEPEKAKKIVEILYAHALLMADLPLEDPGAYSDLVCELLG